MVDKQKAKVDKQTEEAAEDKTREIIWNEKVACLQKQYDDSCDVSQKAINESYTREIRTEAKAETAAEEAAEEEARYRGLKETLEGAFMDKELVLAHNLGLDRAFREQLDINFDLEAKLKAARAEKNAANRKLRGQEGVVHVCADCGK